MLRTLSRERMNLARARGAEPIVKGPVSPGIGFVFAKWLAPGPNIRDRPSHQIGFVSQKRPPLNQYATQNIIFIAN